MKVSDWQSANEVIRGVYFEAIALSMKLSQTVGEKNDYYITLQQLEQMVQTAMNETT